MFSLGGCKSSFNSLEYVEAILDLSFQGDGTKALQVEEDVEKEDLEETYELFVTQFVEDYIASGLDADDEYRELFGKEIKKIFQTMRYHVKTGKKIDENQYEVTVEITPQDVFVRYNEELAADSKKMQEKIESGFYSENQEEKEEQIQREILYRSLELLKIAASNSEYSETEEVNLRVHKNDDGKYEIEEQDLSELVVKILKLDELITGN